MVKKCGDWAATNWNWDWGSRTYGEDVWGQGRNKLKFTLRLQDLWWRYVGTGPQQTEIDIEAPGLMVKICGDRAATNLNWHWGSRTYGEEMWRLGRNKLKLTLRSQDLWWRYVGTRPQQTEIDIDAPGRMVKICGDWAATNWNWHWGSRTYGEDMWRLGRNKLKLTLRLQDVWWRYVGTGPQQTEIDIKAPERMVKICGDKAATNWNWHWGSRTYGENMWGHGSNKLRLQDLWWKYVGTGPQQTEIDIEAPGLMVKICGDRAATNWTWHWGSRTYGEDSFFHLRFVC